MKLTASRAGDMTSDRTTAVCRVFYTLQLLPAAYMSQTRDQKHFTISEVAADWHEL